MEFKLFAQDFASISPLKIKKNAAPTGSVTIETGGSFSDSELSAAKFMKRLGHEVILRSPSGTRAGGKLLIS